MNDAATPHPAGPSRRRGGLKTLLVLVATSALVFRAWLTIREHLRPTLGTIRALRSRDVEERRGAAHELASLGPEEALEAIPPLVAATADGDALVRREVLEALGRAVVFAAADPGDGAEVTAGVAVLGGALDDHDAATRRRAVHFLAECMGHSAGDPSLVAGALARAAVLDRSGEVAELAANHLLGLAAGSPLRPPAVLAATLADPGRPGDRRGVAALLLGAFPAGRTEALAPLVGALADPNPLVRRGAAAGLARFDADALRPAVPALLAVAAEPPAGEEPDAGPFLAIGGLTGPRPIEFRSARVGNSPSGISWPGPLNPAAARDPAELAAAALGRAAADPLGDPRPVAALARLLGSPSRWRRRGAAAALNGLGARAAPATPALVEALERAVRDFQRPGPAAVDRDPDPDLIRAVATVAPRTPSAPTAVAALARLVGPRQLWTRNEEAIPALARFGPEAAPALPNLHALARMGQSPLGRLAAATIARIEEAAPKPPGSPDQDAR